MLNHFEWNASALSLQLRGFRDSQTFVERYNSLNIDVCLSMTESLPLAECTVMTPTVSRKKMRCEKESVDELIESKKVGEFNFY